MEPEMRIGVLLLAALLAAPGWLFAPMALIAFGLASVVAYQVLAPRWGPRPALGAAIALWVCFILMLVAENVTIGVRGHKLGEVGANLPFGGLLIALSGLVVPIAMAACILAVGQKRPRQLAIAALAVWAVLGSAAVWIGLTLVDDPRSERDAIGPLGERLIEAPFVVGYLLLVAAAILVVRDARAGPAPEPAAVRARPVASMPPRT